MVSYLERKKINLWQVHGTLCKMLLCRVHACQKISVSSRRALPGICPIGGGTNLDQCILAGPRLRNRPMRSHGLTEAFSLWAANNRMKSVFR
jgi:hypothetical protein